MANFDEMPKHKFETLARKIAEATCWKDVIEKKPEEVIADIGIDHQGFAEEVKKNLAIEKEKLLIKLVDMCPCCKPVLRRQNAFYVKK